MTTPTASAHNGAPGARSPIATAVKKKHPTLRMNAPVHPVSRRVDGRAFRLDLPNIAELEGLFRALTSTFAFSWGGAAAKIGYTPAP